MPDLDAFIDKARHFRFGVKRDPAIDEALKAFVEKRKQEGGVSA